MISLSLGARSSFPLNEFHEIADDTLHRIQETIEEFVEDQDVDGADVEYSVGLRTSFKLALRGSQQMPFPHVCHSDLSFISYGCISASLFTLFKGVSVSLLNHFLCNLARSSLRCCGMQLTGKSIT